MTPKNIPITVASDAIVSCLSCCFSKFTYQAKGDCIAQGEEVHPYNCCPLYAPPDLQVKFNGDTWQSLLGNHESVTHYHQDLLKYQLKQYEKDQAIPSPDGKKIFVTGPVPSTDVFEKMATYSQGDIEKSLTDWEETTSPTYKNLLLAEHQE